MKKSLYERAKVKEYFIANPRTREITEWVLKEDGYQLEFTSIGEFKSSILSLEFEF